MKNRLPWIGLLAVAIVLGVALAAPGPREAAAAAEFAGSKPAAFSITAGPAARCVAELGAEPGRAQAKRIAKALEDASGKDHVRWAVTAVDRGLRFRLEVEDGVLRALAPNGQGGKDGLLPSLPLRPARPPKKAP